MNRKLYRWIFGTTLGIIFVIFLFLVKLSFEAANETQDWQFLNFDFSRRDKIISAYGGLLGSILSFIAILFVILDLVYQRRQRTLEIEEKEASRIQKLHDSLGFIQVYIDKLYENNIKQSEIATKYSLEEKEHPTEMNRMTFYPNTFPKIILDVDRQNIYKAFREFKPGDDWKKIYVDLYKIVDFYDKSSKEVTEKHQIHLNKKYKHSSEIGEKLDTLIDEVSNIRNGIISAHKEHHSLLFENPYFIIVNNFKEGTIAITSERQQKLASGANPEVISSGLLEFRMDIVGPLFDAIMQQYKVDQILPPEFNNLLTNSQEFLRQTEKLIQDSNDYANHISYYNTKYLSVESEYQIRLSHISKLLEPFV